MKKVILISSALLLNSCAYKSFQLQDGSVIECKEYGPGLNTSGWHFENCKDGSKYYEQHSIKQLPDGYKKPVDKSVDVDSRNAHLNGIILNQEEIKDI